MKLAAPDALALPSFLKHLKVLETGGWIISTITAGSAVVGSGEKRGPWEAHLDHRKACLANSKEDEKWQRNAFDLFFEQWVFLDHDISGHNEGRLPLLDAVEKVV